MRSRETVWERPVKYLAGLTLAMLLGWSVCGHVHPGLSKLCGFGRLRARLDRHHGHQQQFRSDDDGMIVLNAFGNPPIQYNVGFGQVTVTGGN